MTGDDRARHRFDNFVEVEQFLHRFFRRIHKLRICGRMGNETTALVIVGIQLFQILYLLLDEYTHLALVLFTAQLGILGKINHFFVNEHHDMRNFECRHNLSFDLCNYGIFTIFASNTREE